MTIDLGRVVWFEIDRPVGSEITKRRPWVIVSGKDMANKGLITVCPITSQPVKDPRQSVWYVPLKPSDFVGEPLAEGGVWTHHIRTISALRIRPEDITRTRLRADALGLLSQATSAILPSPKVA